MRFPLPLSRHARNGTAATPLPESLPQPTSTGVGTQIPVPRSPLSAVLEARRKSPRVRQTPQDSPDRATLDPLPRARSEQGSIRGRGAYVDPPLPVPDATFDEVGLENLCQILHEQKRASTADWLGFLFNQQVQTASSDAAKRIQEAYHNLREWNAQNDLRNLELDDALEILLKQQETAVQAPQERALAHRVRAQLAHRLAARAGGRAGVTYDAQDPQAAIKEYTERALVSSKVYEALAKASGEQAEATQLLESLPKESEIEHLAPEKTDTHSTEITLGNLAILFGVAAFVSICAASGIVPIATIFNGSVILKNLWAMVIFVPVCIGAAKALSMPLTWCGELAGAGWFHDDHPWFKERGKRLALGAGITAGVLGFLAIPIDAAIHRSGFLKSALIDAQNVGKAISPSDYGIYWLMALFLVLGYVVCSFGAGVMKSWYEFKFILARKEYAKTQLTKHREELQRQLAAAKKSEAIAKGLEQALPHFTELAKDETFQSLVAACNRAIAIEHTAQQAEAEVGAVVGHFDRLITSLENQRQAPQEKLSGEDKQLVEEAVYTAHYQIQLFRAHLYHLKHEVELPWLLRWLRRWFWFWEPRRVHWGKM